MTEVADALVVFGITGDLARTKTLPALYDLVEQGILTCPVIGVGRRPLREDEMREHARSAIEDGEGRRPRPPRPRHLPLATHVRGRRRDGRRRLRAARESTREGEAARSSTSPSLRRASSRARSTSLAPASSDKARLVVEKPFGTDLVSARDLNRRLTALVPEERLYRIDHFLGKEPVQDIMYPALLERAVRAGLEPRARRLDPGHDGRGLRGRGPGGASTTGSAHSATSFRTTSCRCLRS